MLLTFLIIAVIFSDILKYVTSNLCCSNQFLPTIFTTITPDTQNSFLNVSIDLLFSKIPEIGNGIQIYQSKYGQ